MGRVQWDAAISSFGKARDGQGGVDKAIGGAEAERGGSEERGG